MKFIPTEIPDVWVIEPKVFEDGRGFFYESYRETLFGDHGIRDAFVQDNHVRSEKGVLRGLHYQVEPMAQAKMVCVAVGEIYDVAVDIRKDSKTFGKAVQIRLDDKNRRMLYIPKGFAHGYCALKDGTEVLYKVSQYYSPEHERGILWKDPALGIRWPKLEGAYRLSEKDKQLPTLKQALAGSA